MDDAATLATVAAGRAAAVAGLRTLADRLECLALPDVAAGDNDGVTVERTAGRVREHAVREAEHSVGRGCEVRPSGRSVVRWVWGKTECFH